MHLVERYFITVYVIPEKLTPIVAAIKKVEPLQYGHYKWVYFVSEAGEEFFNALPEAGKNVSADLVQSNKACKLEFSIPRSADQLQTVLECIRANHHWDEPVIRVFEVKETRVEG